MSTPRVQRNKRTGELRVSYDDGATWQAVALPPAADTGTSDPEPDAGDPGEPQEPPEPTHPPSPPAGAATPSVPQAAGGGPLQTQPPPDAYGDWLARAGRWAGETATDFGRSLGGLANSATPAVAAMLTPEVDDGTGIPREYAAGSATGDMIDQNRRDAAEAAQRSPIATGAARGLSTAAQLIPAAAAGAAPVVGWETLGQAVAPAVLAGAIDRGGAALDPRKPVEQWGAETYDPGAMATDATVGMAIPAGLKAVSGLPQAVTEPIRAAAFRNRGAAAGASGAELAKQELRQPGFTEKLGRDIEREGLHQRPPGMDWIPSTANVYGQNARALRGKLDATIGQSLEDAGAQGVTIPTSDVLAGMRSIRAAMPRNTPQEYATRNAVTDQIKLTAGKYGDTMTPRQAHGLKKSFEGAAGFKPGSNATPSETAVAKQYRKLASVPRRALSTAMEEQAEQTVTAPAFADATARYPTAARVEAYGLGRAARDAGNLPTGLGGKATGGIPGLVMSEIERRGGRDIMADALHGTARTLEGSATARAATDSGAGSVAAPAVVQATPEDEYAAWLADQDLRARLREQER